MQMFLSLQYTFKLVGVRRIRKLAQTYCKAREFLLLYKQRALHAGVEQFVYNV